jgi:hypothetical protein
MMERVMAKWWLGVALTVVGLAVAGPASAQYSLPDDEGAAGLAPANYLPPGPVPAAVPPPPPGPPGPYFPPGAEPVGGSAGGPDNAFPAPDCCPHCDAKECFHFDVDYLGWFTRKNNLPPLVTSGRANDPLPGALGERGTEVLLGRTTLDDTFHSGIRLTGAVDLDSAKVWSVEASAFYLENKVFRDTFAGGSDPGSLVLARPFVNGATNTESAIPISFPGLLAGNLNVALNERFYGGDANVRYNLWPGNGYGGRCDFLAGARYLGLEDGLGFFQNVQEATGQAHFGVAETFRTTNRFYGGQVGLAYEGNVGAAFVNLLGKFAVGQTHQTLINSAVTQLTDASGILTNFPNQGVFVQPSNVGRFSRWQTSFVPEFSFMLGYEFNKNLRLAAGYNLILWTNVVRPEDQFDRTLNLQPADGTAVRPEANFHTSTFWAQGFTGSLQLSF